MGGGVNAVKTLIFEKGGRCMGGVNAVKILIFEKGGDA